MLGKPSRAIAGMRLNTEKTSFVVETSNESLDPRRNATIRSDLLSNFVIEIESRFMNG